MAPSLLKATHIVPTICSESHAKVQTPLGFGSNLPSLGHQYPRLSYPLMSHGSCCFSLRSVPPPHLFSVATSSAETLPTVPGTCEALTSDVLAFTLSLPVLGHRGEKIFSKRRLCACHRPCSKISSHCLMDTAYALWSGTPYPRFGQPSLLNGSPSAPRALGTSHTRLLIVTRLW